MGEPCVCCGLETGCGKQAEQRQRAEAAADAPPLGVWFRAQYPGFCSGCGDDFNTGDRIALASAHGGHRCYVADCCAELVNA